MIKGLLLSNVDIEIIKTTSGLTIDEINNIKKLLQFIIINKKLDRVFIYLAYFYYNLLICSKTFN